MSIVWLAAWVAFLGIVAGVLAILGWRGGPSPALDFDAWLRLVERATAKPPSPAVTLPDIEVDPARRRSVRHRALAAQVRHREDLLRQRAGLVSQLGDVDGRRNGLLSVLGDIDGQLEAQQQLLAEVVLDESAPGGAR